MRRDYTFDINGEKWLIRFSRLRGKAAGWCDYKRRKILVHNSLTPKQTLDTLIHEVTHAIHPQLCEESVVYTGAKLAEIICGVGLVKEEKPCEVRRPGRKGN